MDLLHLRITWNWLEAGHGKGPCDGVGGALKGLADRVVKSTGSIQSAEEFMEQIAPETNKIKLLLATDEEITHCAEVVDSWESPPVYGLMGYHQATVHEGKLFVRVTSCYEECCFVDDLVPLDDLWAKATKYKPSSATTHHNDTVQDLHEDEGQDFVDLTAANEPGIMEEPYSSDEEVHFDNFVSQVRRKEKRKKREVIRQRAADRAAAKQAHEDGDPEEESDDPEQFSESSSDDDDHDSDYVPPEVKTPEELARDAAVASARRQGLVIKDRQERSDPHTCVAGRGQL